MGVSICACECMYMWVYVHVGVCACGCKCWVCGGMGRCTCMMSVQVCVPGDCYVQCTRYNYGRMSSLSHLQ